MKTPTTVQHVHKMLLNTVTTVGFTVCCLTVSVMKTTTFSQDVHEYQANVLWKQSTITPGCQEHPWRNIVYSDYTVYTVKFNW